MLHESTGMRMDPALERALVARSRDSADAFGSLYDFYLPRIYGFILRRVGDRAVAEDLTATTFERALASIRRGDFRNESFGGWLYRVASNAVVDHVRRARRTASPAWATEAAESTSTTAEVGDEAAAAAFAAALDRDALRRALLAIPDTHRQIIVLKFFDGLDTDELCAALGCSRPTLAVRLHRALRALRAAMTRESTDAA